MLFSDFISDNYLNLSAGDTVAMFFIRCLAGFVMKAIGFSRSCYFSASF